MSNIQEIFGSPAEGLPSICQGTDEFICGVEYEIEDIKKINYEVLEQENIIKTEDGSLRNNGVEFITAPQSFFKTLHQFKKLHDALTLGPNAYSERTSIHVHVNVSGLNTKQFARLIKLYLLLEPSFFYLAGEKRKNNIHCVPLSFTIIPSNLTKSMQNWLTGWTKYAALNVGEPIRKLGTIEFRHMYGTGDYEVFKTWLKHIRDLYIFARDNEFDIKDFLSHGGKVTHLHTLVFNEECPLKESDYQVSKMDTKLTFV